MSEPKRETVDCPNCGQVIRIELRVDLNDDITKQLVQVLRKEIRRGGGDVQRALG